MGKTKKIEPRRSYTGVVVTSENYKTFTKEERTAHQRHLRAYLSGKMFYHHGFFTNEISMRQRLIRVVGQKFEENS